MSEELFLNEYITSTKTNFDIGVEHQKIFVVAPIHIQIVFQVICSFRDNI